MEVDSENFTPPSSPIIGYSGCDDEQSIIASGVVYCLNCKGVPRAHDHSFSPEGLLLRREAISAIENLRSDHANSYCFSKEPKLLTCFGHQFDPFDKQQVKKMILICLRNISSLEILSESSHTFNYDIAAVSEDPDSLFNQNPWVLRKEVCQFLNVIVRELRYYRTKRGTQPKPYWSSDVLQELFTGLKKTLLPVQDWSNVLKNHCGYKSGNECSSAAYHFFHLQLELRWSLFLIFGATHSMADWLCDELLQLHIHKYKLENVTKLDELQPFNCTCVKEIWTMIKLVIEHMQPDCRQEKPFWKLYTEAVQRCPGSDPYFSIWLTSHLAEISDYGIAGVHCAGSGRVDSKENGNNALQWLHGVYKEWVTRGGKSSEILRLSFSLFQHWGGDFEILGALWLQWVPRLDGRTDVSNLDSYSTVDKWLVLITQICQSSAELCGSFIGKDKDNMSGAPIHDSFSIGGTSQTRHLGSNNDTFMEFVSLVAAYARWATQKDIRRLQSNFCMKLHKCNTKDFGEIGIIRVSSLFMALTTVIELEGEAVSMFDRLQAIFPLGMAKKFPGRRKLILRVYSCMIIILLKKKNISLNSNPLIKSLYMKTVDELLCQKFPDQASKDLAMVYIDFLDCLPKHTPPLHSKIDLGRCQLISSNLSMWLANAGHNYVLRTARCLSQITEWILKWVMGPTMFSTPLGSEGNKLYAEISEKSLPFLKSVVILNSSRIPSTDVEPLACLAADIALLSRKFRPASVDYENDFELFAMHERTCPLVSQYFIQRLLQSSDYIEGCFHLVKWTQTWIRLVALDCSVPDELTEIVLNNGFSSTSNEALLREYCNKLKLGTCDQKELQSCLQPLTVLLKGVLDASLFKDDQRESVHVIKSVISSCTLVLKEIKFEYLYVKGVTSVAHQFLDLMAPPSWPSAWDKFSVTVLKCLEKSLYDVFKAVALYPGSAHDPYIKRKMRDIVVFAFFGFIKRPEDVNREQHPAFRIMDLTEDQEIRQVQSDILPNLIAGDHVVEDVKLCQLFLSCVQMFRANNMTTTVIRLLSGVIRAFITHYNPLDKQNIMNSCINTVVYCCLIGSSNNSPFHTKLVLEGFQKAFEKQFCLRSKQVFLLCNAIVKSRNATNRTLDAKRFLKLEIIPLLKEWVERCEQKRGIGRDQSLREPLKKLESDTAEVPI